MGEVDEEPVFRLSLRVTKMGRFSSRGLLCVREARGGDLLGCFIKTADCHEGITSNLDTEGANFFSNGYAQTCAS